MNLIANVDLPNGVRSGQRFAVTDVQGTILLGIGVVHRAEAVEPTTPDLPKPDLPKSDAPTTDEDEDVEKDADETVPHPATPSTRTRRGPAYQRRDITAEESGSGDHR